MKKKQLCELAWPGGIMLGKIIKPARQKLGLTQKQLGLLCGYPESSAERTVQHWEHDRQNPPLEKIRALAAALKIPLDQLIP